MIGKIWNVLAQILCYQPGSANIIKPFFENLNNENVNDEKYVNLLKTFSTYQLEVLYKNGIIPKEKINFLFSSSKNKSFFSFEDLQDNNTIKDHNIEEIISEDKIFELQEFIQESDIQQFKLIFESFNEVQEMEIPLIQYCIMKNAIECFKYLLVNGYDDPNKTMEEDNPNSANYNWKNEHRYQWNCMATAIYFGNNEIIKILENRRAENRQNLTYIVAAILSYRNANVTKILDELQNSDEFKNYLNTGFLAAAKSNNLKEAEILLSKGARINIKDIIYLYIKIIFFFTIIKNK